jgi:hypothetical protein
MVALPCSVGEAGSSIESVASMRPIYLRRSKQRAPMEAGTRNRRELGSWKEIAAYLGKGVRTVQRWENDLGLPVRRPNNSTKGVVCASTEDLDRWLAMQWRKRPFIVKGTNPNSELAAAIKASQELRRANRQLADELLQNLQALRNQCTALAQASAEAKKTRMMVKRRGG